jgi:hypothetical protein
VFLYALRAAVLSVDAAREQAEIAANRSRHRECTADADRQYGDAPRALSAMSVPAQAVEVVDDL